MKKINRIALLATSLSLCISISACAPYQQGYSGYQAPRQAGNYPSSYSNVPTYTPPPVYQESPQTNGTNCSTSTNLLAGAAGAVVGGVVGSRFGKGGGKTAMTVIGAGSGALAGSAIGCR